MSTSTNEQRVVAVVGATGRQGGGLVRSIVADPDGGLAVRAITRDAGSPRAKELAALGAAVVVADLDDPGSVEAAFDGAYGAFCVTAGQEHPPERETAHAATMAAAARRAGLAHVVWSTFEDTRTLADDRVPVLPGGYRVPHYDAKGAADAAFEGVPTTFLRTAFYWENFLDGGGPRRGDDGVLALALPLGPARLPGIAVADIGRCAHAILRRPELAGQTISVSGENLTGAELASAFAEFLGEPVRFADVPPDVLPAELANMFRFTREFEAVYAGARDPAETRKLHPGLLTFSAWLSERNPR
ncbi:NmrA family NAD(P)-binding protein [Amycolatopsis sp. OK19-0408]|uniref:NmrA family NAD(P)-binding protein n=1 Tax=Amycolatopsis iheyensis TaxID=2945988 RepID=A0A9X2NCG5_9PSEU|nr:NmrA family NAD(P)-binding protein [Amycolatopsis iheyensis]MCR6481980.1 NmrA family NAD(P)-binding protein [Amycolatopsis iheyensis]